MSGKVTTSPITAISKKSSYDAQQLNRKTVQTTKNSANCKNLNRNRAHLFNANKDAVAASTKTLDLNLFHDINFTTAVTEQNEGVQ